MDGNIFRKLDIGDASAHHRHVVAVLSFLRERGRGDSWRRRLQREKLEP